MNQQQRVKIDSVNTDNDFMTRITEVLPIGQDNLGPCSIVFPHFKDRN